jgi:serine phosphatase RsbU (regulator of sigma subunit)
MVPMAKHSGSDDTTLRAFTVPTPPRDTDRAHYLVVIAGAIPGLRVRLADQPLVIGRNAPADWVLGDAEVSRTHCEVRISGDEVVVIDLDSSNGTFIEGQRVAGKPRLLPVGARLQLGRHVIEHEWATREEVEESQAREHDVEKAGRYLRSLLPKPLRTGPLRADWVHIPSARVGGNVFGYRIVEERLYAMYLIDMSGHGTGAAMHAVSVLNLLYRGALPVTDFGNPSNVLETLNVMFDMETHGGLSFTLWYGVYNPVTRQLRFASAGHHPAFLVPRERDRAIPLETHAPVIGVNRGIKFSTSAIDVPPKSMLYVFSDGVFEFETAERDVWGLDSFIPLLVRPPIPGKPEPLRLADEVRAIAGRETFEDDFALMAFTFP